MEFIALAFLQNIKWHPPGFFSAIAAGALSMAGCGQIPPIAVGVGPGIPFGRHVAELFPIGSQASALAEVLRSEEFTITNTRTGHFAGDYNTWCGGYSVEWDVDSGGRIAKLFAREIPCAGP